MTVAQALDELLMAAAAAGWEVRDRLAPGLSDAAIDEITATLAFSLPDELRAVYRLYDGITPSTDPRRRWDSRVIVPEVEFWSLAEVVEAHRTMRSAGSWLASEPPYDTVEIHQEGWREVALPMWATDDLVVMRLAWCDGPATEPARSGLLFIEDGEVTDAHDSLESMFRTERHRWRSGVYYVDEDGTPAGFESNGRRVPL